MTYLINILIILGAFVSMEFVAWFTHKYIMHGFLWFLHKDHHDQSNIGVLEKNDYFFLIFATPGILNIFIGFDKPSDPFLWIGIGITMYGFAYFFIHDLFIHQRIKVLRNTQNKYLMALRRAHKIHHKNINKKGGESFGMLLVGNKINRSTKQR